MAFKMLFLVCAFWACQVAFFPSDVAAQLSLGEIVQAVESRDTCAGGESIHYEVSLERTAAFYRHEALREAMAGGMGINEAIEAAAEKPLDRIIADSEFVERQRFAYVLDVSEKGYVRCVFYDPVKLLSGEKQVASEVVLVDGTAKSLDRIGLRGRVQSAASEDVIPDQTPFSLLELNGSSVVDLLASESARVVETRRSNGDILAVVEIPSGESTFGVSPEVSVIINLSKGAWPIRISEKLVSSDGAFLEPLVIEVDGFHQSGACYYPKAITRTRTLGAPAAAPDGEFGGAAEIVTAKVTLYEANPEFSAGHFDLDYPPETVYLNSDTGEILAKDASGKTIPHAEWVQAKHPAPALPPPSAPRSGSFRYWFLVANVAIICFAASVYCMRFYRRHARS